MTELGKNVASVRGKVTKIEPVKPVGEKAVPVCNMSIAAPRASVGSVAKDNNGNPKPSYIDVAVWGNLAEKCAMLSVGDTVDITGVAIMEEWENKKVPPREDGKAVLDTKVRMNVDGENNFVQRATEQAPVNLLELTGDIVYLADPEPVTWTNKQNEKKSGHIRRMFVAVPVEKNDGTIVRPTMHVKCFGHKCETLTVGDRVELRGEIENDSWKVDGTKEDEKVNRYAGVLMVGVSGSLTVSKAAAAA